MRLDTTPAIVAILATLAASALPAVAQDAEDVSKVELIAEAAEVHPGQTVLLGLRFELADHWHIYWDGRNDTGFAPMVDWTVPEGVSVGPMLWPAPQRYVSPGNILDHVYEGSPTILVPVTISPDAAAGTSLAISGEVEWLVCNDICLPGFGPVSTELNVVAPQGDAGEEQGRLSTNSDLGKAAAKLPEPITEQTAPEELSLHWSDEAVSVRFAGASAMAFYPAMASASLVSTLDDGQVERDTLMLRLAPAERDLSTADERRLVGVLEVRRGDGPASWYQIDFGPDGLKSPENARILTRVRQRVGQSSARGG